MQPYTGHLVKVNSDAEAESLIAAGYREVQAEYMKAVKAKLAGKSEATVSLTSGGKLSKLCSSWRKEDRRSKQIARLGRVEINRRRAKRRRKQKINERDTGRMSA